MISKKTQYDNVCRESIPSDEICNIRTKYGRMQSTEIISIELPTDQKTIIEKIKGTSFEKIIISNVKYATDGLGLLTSEFMSELEKMKNLIRIHFKVKESFEENFGNDYTFIKEKSLIVTFETILNQQCKNKIFWTLSGDDKHFSVGVLDEQVSEFCRDVIADEIINDRNGILEGYKKVTLASIGNDHRDNLLTLSVKIGSTDLVERLLKLGFDVDYENDEGLTAIDIAWIECKTASEENLKNFSKIILTLLNYDSRLPQNDFDIQKLSEDVQNFVLECDALRSFIKNADSISLMQRIRQKPNLRYFYDKNNQSLIAYAIEIGESSIIDELISYGLGIGKNEYINIEKINYLSVLKSKSKVAKGQKDSNLLWEQIINSYNFLNENEISSKVLQIAASWRNLKIDFKNDLNEDPAELVYSVEGIYLHGNVSIDASSILKEQNNSKVSALLLKELCYLAISITFMNDSKSYPRGSSDTKRISDAMVAKYCKEEFVIPDEFSDDEFSLCCKELIPERIIVLIIPMLLTYWQSKNRSENFKQRIKEQKRKYANILNYYKEIILPQFEVSLNVLNILQDRTRDIKYIDLTQPMQLKVQTVKIIFQGYEVSPLGLFDEELKFISTKDIKGLLIDNRQIKLGDPHRDRLALGLVERNYMNISDKQVKDPKIKNFSTLYNEISKSKICVIADHPGTGKTQAFKYIAKKLKHKNETFFVLRLKLRRHCSIYDKHNHTQKVQLRDVFEIFKHILNFSFDFENKVFEKLFFESKVIFLLDGFDEICPEYFEFWIKIFQIIKNYTSIQLWIFTRPLCVKKLSEALSIETYTLAPLSSHEKEEIIRLFIDESHDSNKLLNQINNVFVNIFDENCQNFVNNPLILQVIAETSSKQKEIDLEFKSPYRLFKIIINAYKDKVDKKVNIKDQKPFSYFSFDEVHQVFAIKYLFEDENEELKYNDLEIIKNWEDNKKYLTTEMIQRYGFLTVEVEDLNSKIDKGSIKFIHSKFTDFFVANYLYALITNSCNTEESEIAFCLLETITNNLHKFETVLSFLLDHLKDDKKDKDIDANLINLFKRNMDEIRCAIFKAISLKHMLLLLEFWSFVMSKNRDDLHKFWLIAGLIDKSDNLLKQLLLDNSIQEKMHKGSKKCEFLKEVLTIVEMLFGSSWDQIFSKVEIKPNQIEFRDNEPHKIFYTNLLKLLLVIENNYNQDIQKVFIVQFYESCLLKNISEVVGVYIMQIASRIFKNNKKLFLKIIFKFLEYSQINNIEVILKFICEVIENNFKDDQKNIKSLLFYRYSFERHPLFLASNSNNIKYFNQLKTYYIRNVKDLRKIFNSDYDFPKIILKVSTENRPEFKNFVIETFKGNEDQILDFICDDYQINFELIMSDESFEFLKAFSNELFCDNPEKANKIIKKVLVQNCSDGNHPFILALESKDIKYIRNIKTRFKNQNISADDLTVILQTPEKLMRSLQFIKNQKKYDELEEIFKDILASNKETCCEIERNTRKYLQRKNSEEISREDLKYVNQFLNFVSKKII